MSSEMAAWWDEAVMSLSWRLLRHGKGEGRVSWYVYFEPISAAEAESGWAPRARYTSRD